MALNAYLKLKSKKEGDIKGSVTQKGREGKILVIAAEHELLLPLKPDTFDLTDKRVHRPFTITKELDRSSPVLYRLLVGNERLVEWELQFWGASSSKGSGAGIETQRYTVKLSSARVADIRFHMPNTRHADLAKLSEYEDVSFTYEAIEWIWKDGPVTAVDSLKAL